MLTIDQIESVLEQAKIKPVAERLSYYNLGHRDLIREYRCADASNQQRYSYFYPSDISFDRKETYKTSSADMEIGVLSEHPGRVAFCIGMLRNNIALEEFRSRITKLRQEIVGVKRTSLRNKLITAIEKYFPTAGEASIVLLSRQHVYLEQPNNKKFTIVP